MWEINAWTAISGIEGAIILIQWKFIYTLNKRMTRLENQFAKHFVDPNCKNDL